MLISSISHLLAAFEALRSARAAGAATDPLREPRAEVEAAAVFGATVDILDHTDGFENVRSKSSIYILIYNSVDMPVRRPCANRKSSKHFL